MKYDFTAIEKKWQKKWVEEKTFACKTGDTSKPKFFGLVEFPYPSGNGLHVGHARPYTAMDVVARKKRMDGYNVLFPMGFDAFGLPAENYAIKTGTHPAITTNANIANFTRQIKSLGFSSISLNASSMVSKSTSLDITLKPALRRNSRPSRWLFISTPSIF